MKKPIFLLILILTACTPTVDTPAPLLITVTSPAPTATITLTPTPTFTPTETPDPLAGAPPGTTRVENGKPYMDRMENGKKVAYEWTTIQVVENKLNVWTTSHVEGGSMNDEEAIPLLRNSDMMPWRIKVSSSVGQDAPIFRQHAYKSSPRSLAGALWPKLIKNNDNFTSAQYLDLWTAIERYDPRASKSFTTPDGVRRTWLLYEGYEFNWLSWDEMGNLGTYWETTDASGEVVYRWTITVDDSGSLKAYGAVEHPELLDMRQVFSLVLHSLGKVVMEDQLPDSIPNWGFSSPVSDFIAAQLKTEANIVELDPPRPNNPLR